MAEPGCRSEQLVSALRYSSAVHSSERSELRPRSSPDTSISARWADPPPGRRLRQRWRARRSAGSPPKTPRQSTNDVAERERAEGRIMVAENGLGDDRCLHTSGLGSLATGVHRAGLAPREPGMSRVERSGRRWAASASGSHFYVRAEASPWYTASGHREPAATSLFRQKYAHARCEHSPPPPPRSDGPAAPLLTAHTAGPRRAARTRRRSTRRRLRGCRAWACRRRGPRATRSSPTPPARPNSTG